MFLLQALTPPEHEVLLIDGNTQPMSDAELVRFALERKIDLVGIGAMTRMVARAYRVADALRAAGVRVSERPMPSMTAKNITARKSPSAIALSGFDGTICTSSSNPVLGACAVVATAAARSGAAGQPAAQLVRHPRRAAAG
jgi:hypothetical protein